ncbi:MAG: Ig-like domain repeat protein [Actinomycetota bacterium]|nr:Ig-like domain repeat protein [Actinomycetota bacterium]
MFIADEGNGRVVKVPAGGGAQTTVATGLPSPAGVAVDVPPATSSFGAAVSLTATVQTSPSGGTPTGTVTFTDRTTTLGTANLSGTLPDTATLSTAPLPVGTDHVTATYGGNTNNMASSASAPIAVAVAKAAQTITFTSTPPANATVGGTYTVTAVGGPSGNPVTFSSATPSVCTATGSTATFIRAGTCVIDANQAGTANYLPAAQVHQSATVNKPSSSTPPVTGGNPPLAASGSSTPAPATPPATEPPSGPLAFTGSNIIMLLLDAATLLAVGLALTTIATKRRKRGGPG